MRRYAIRCHCCGHCYIDFRNKKPTKCKYCNHVFYEINCKEINAPPNDTLSEDSKIQSTITREQYHMEKR